MLNKFHKIFFVLIVTTLPTLSFAQNLNKTKALLTSLKDLVTQVLIPLVFTLALLVFFWGVVKYIRSEGLGKEEGKKIMIWGTIALFVMSSIWGIITLLRSELGIGSESNMPIPTIGGQSGASK